MAITIDAPFTLPEVNITAPITLGFKGDQGIPGPQGEEGDSAYEVAVDNGFVGTEQEWLESIRREDYLVRISTDTTLTQAHSGKLLLLTNDITLTLDTTNMLDGWNVGFFNMDTDTKAINRNGETILSKGSDNPILSEQKDAGSLTWDAVNQVFIGIGDWV